MKIYKREYDNPNYATGGEKPNEFLGDFKIIETIREDTYSSTRIGVRIDDNSEDVYLIEEFKVSFSPMAGTKFITTKLASVVPVNCV